MLPCLQFYHFAGGVREATRHAERIQHGMLNVQLLSVALPQGGWAVRGEFVAEIEK